MMISMTRQETSDTSRRILDVGSLAFRSASLSECSAPPSSSSRAPAGPPRILHTGLSAPAVALHSLASLPERSAPPSSSSRAPAGPPRILHTGVSASAIALPRSAPPQSRSALPSSSRAPSGPQVLSSGIRVPASHHKPLPRGLVAVTMLFMMSSVHAMKPGTVTTLTKTPNGYVDAYGNKFEVLPPAQPVTKTLQCFGCKGSCPEHTDSKYSVWKKHDDDHPKCKQWLSKDISITDVPDMLPSQVVMCPDCRVHPKPHLEIRWQQIDAKRQRNYRYVYPKDTTYNDTSKRVITGNNSFGFVINVTRTSKGEEGVRVFVDAKTFWNHMFNNRDCPGVFERVFKNLFKQINFGELMTPTERDTRVDNVLDPCRYKEEARRITGTWVGHILEGCTKCKCTGNKENNLVNTYLRTVKCECRNSGFPMGTVPSPVMQEYSFKIWRKMKSIVVDGTTYFVPEEMETNGYLKRALRAWRTEKGQRRRLMDRLDQAERV